MDQGREWKISRVLVMGAGAVGGYFGAMIDRLTDVEVYYIARGAHLEAMLLNGLTVKSGENEYRLQVTASDDPSSVETPDLVLLTVKSYDTGRAIEQLKPVVDEATQILTLQNGVDNYGKLVDAFGAERVIQGFCRIGASVPKPGVVSHSSLGTITIGNPQKNKPESRHEKVRKLFSRAGVECRFSAQIQHDIWAKFAWNCIFNMLTTVAFVTVDKLFEIEESEQLCHDLFDEIQLVAGKEGIRLDEQDRSDIIDGARDLVDFKTSTYQDREKGKSLEFEAFTGSVVRRADRHNLEVPRHRTLYALLKLIDQFGTKT